jgi:parallel beta-helix repeat protein
MAFDGTANNTITDNVCFDEETACISLYSDTNSVVDHNVMQTGGADPGACNIMHDTSAPIQSCTNSSLLINSHKSGDRLTTGEIYTNNVSPRAPNVESGSLATNTNNLWSGATSPNINGTPTFLGGTNPTTWAGFALTAGSAGHAAGTDGGDVGIRLSAGGPPTGGGSAPVNTAAPSLSGTTTQGQTLTTTNGTWTITGNIPTVTTYQWFDCPTSTFSTGSCTPIQPQTAPTSANGPTYTLGASDVGNYIFTEVTVTNANGQINAISHPTGPIAG